MQGVRGLKACYKESPFPVYGAVFSDYLLDDEVTHRITNLRIAPMPAVDVRFLNDFAGIQRGSMPPAYDVSRQIGASLPTIPNNANPVRAIRVYREAGKPQALYVATPATTGYPVNTDAPLVRIESIPIGPLGVGSLTTLPQTMVENQVDTNAGGGPGSSYGTHYSSNVTWFLPSGWCIGKEHVGIQQNHPFMAATGLDWKIFSWKMDGSAAVIGGSTALVSTSEWKVYKMAAHDAPWVVAFKFTTGQIAVGQMLTQTEAQLSNNEVVRVIGNYPTLTNVRWYDRVRGYDYALISTDGDTAQYFYNGRRDQWFPAPAARACFVDHENNIYLVGTSTIWKVDGTTHDTIWTDSDVAGGPIPPGGIYLDGNERWVHVFNCNRNFDVAPFGVFPTDSYGADPYSCENWSVDFDGELFVPHRTYSKAASVVDDPDSNNWLLVPKRRYYTVFDKRDPPITPPDTNTPVEFREFYNYATNPDEFVRPVNTDAVEQLGCACMSAVPKQVLH